MNLTNRPVLISILAATMFLGSCGGDGAWQILKQDQQWIAQITRMNLGPDEYFEGDFRYKPQKEEHRFIWVHLNLSNQTGSAINWDHNSVYLLAGKMKQDPFRVLKTDGINQSPVNAKEKIASGANATRILLFSFPREMNPEKIILGPLGEAPVPESILFDFR
jgi:hypothetical protein